MLNFSNKNKRITKHLNDKGSTLITVIVVVAFISVLATVLLYLVAENYKTKIYDLKTKESFYEAEEIVEQFKASLVRSVATCSKPAYDNVVIDFAQSKTKEIRETQYFTGFKTVFDSEIYNRSNAVTSESGNISVNAEGIVNGFVPGSTPEPGDTGYYLFEMEDGKKLRYKIELSSEDYNVFYKTVSSDNVYNEDGEVASYLLGDVKFTVVDSSGYVSVISTSFQITPPQLNWGTSSSDQSLQPDFSECVKYYDYKKE